MKLLLIDNLDSFSFSLVEALASLGAEVRVLRNSVDPKLALSQAQQDEALLLLSPGPGRPEDAGCCMDLVRLARGRVPLLGVCLGHQAIVLEAGGTVTRAPEPVHGKASLLEHDGAGPFEGLDAPVRVGRYHSLATRDIPPRFTVHAAIEGMAMAISDAGALQTGLQFHPESVLTPTGSLMLANILRQARGQQPVIQPQGLHCAGA